MQPLTLESFLTSIPTSSNAIEYTREASFTNAAAETAEAGSKPETGITFALNSMPVSTVAHWVKISKQLAADAPALAAYVNTRMAYGVNLRVEQQLGAGDGVAPNISGLLDSGNFTAHGYADADLGATLKKFVLIRMMIADAWANGYPADAIVMNPADAAQLEIDALTSTSNAARINVNAAGQMSVFGLPIVQSIGITADNILVGAFGQSATVHNRQGVTVELSESDGSNFTTNLVTVRAERRLALTVERPAGIIGGDLTPV
jgi:HK97 family phage major capsid protein